MCWLLGQVSALGPNDQTHMYKDVSELQLCEGDILFLSFRTILYNSCNTIYAICKSVMRVCCFARREQQYKRRQIKDPRHPIIFLLQKHKTSNCILLSPTFSDERCVVSPSPALCPNLFGLKTCKQQQQQHWKECWPSDKD